MNFAFCLLGFLLVHTAAQNSFPSVVDILQESLNQQDEEAVLVRTNTISSGKLGSLSQSNGYLYYNFYSGNGCNETISYSTGIASETCMSYQYYAPPDHYYYSFLHAAEQFNSFQIKSLSNGCIDTYVAYYADDNCQNLNYTASLSSLGAGTCKAYNNQTYTNMKTFKAFCSVTNTIPAQENTYVVSSYNASNCNGMAYSYNAYASGDCYGVYSVNNSYSYECSGSTVLKNDYYGSLTCAASSSAMSIDFGCANSQFVAHPTPVATVSTLVTCNYPASTESSTKYTEGQIVGIAMALVFGLTVVVLVAGYFISGHLFQSTASSSSAAGSSYPPGDESRSSEMSAASLSPSMVGRYNSNVETCVNPILKQ